MNKEEMEKMCEPTDKQKEHAKARKALKTVLRGTLIWDSVRLGTATEAVYNARRKEVLGEIR